MLEVILGCAVVYVLVGFFINEIFKITLDKLVKMWYKQINNQGGYYGK